jgi:hypothetical protein
VRSYQISHFIRWLTATTTSWEISGAKPLDKFN